MTHCEYRSEVEYLLHKHEVLDSILLNVREGWGQGRVGTRWKSGTGLVGKLLSSRTLA